MYTFDHFLNISQGKRFNFLELQCVKAQLEFPKRISEEFSRSFFFTQKYSYYICKCWKDKINEFSSPPK